MSTPASSVFPTFKSFARLNSLSRPHEKTTFWDVKFYPVTPPGIDPVFAVVGGAEIIVCRPSSVSSDGIEVVAWLHNEDPQTSVNSCAWARHPETDDPLLCVAGDTDAIRVFDIKSQRLIKGVNDLAVSPHQPSILASVSYDYTVRFWSLDDKYAKQPCLLTCAGHGHQDGLLTLAFHRSGSYLLTGGIDTVVNLWAIPPLPNETSGTDRPTLLHNPHFSSSAIHANVVDCVAWYGDLILSKSALDTKIVLWLIEGFNSTADTPLPPAPTAFRRDRPTRSAWGGGFQRLLLFDVPAENAPFWMRFSLCCYPAWSVPRSSARAPGSSNGSGHHGGDGNDGGSSGGAVLAMGNMRSKILFWDLESIERWTEESALRGQDRTIADKRKARKRKNAASASSRQVQHAKAVEDTLLPSSSERSGNSSGSDDPDRDEDEDDDVNDNHDDGANDIAEDDDQSLRLAVPMYSVLDASEALRSHKEATVPKVSYVTRQIAWSVGGEWMVAVGEEGMIALFSRAQAG